MVSASPFGRRGGRLSARQHALFIGALPRLALLERMAQLRRTPSACLFRGDLANTGPRFRLERCALSATPRSSASSWQGLVVVPGGAPGAARVPMLRA